MAPNKCTFQHNHVQACLDDKSWHSHLKYEVSMKNKQRRRIPQAAVAGGSVLVVRTSAFDGTGFGGEDRLCGARNMSGEWRSSRLGQLDRRLLQIVREVGGGFGRADGYARDKALFGYVLCREVVLHKSGKRCNKLKSCLATLSNP